MFCHITEDWRGRPLVSREVVVNLTGHTTTTTGLAIRSELVERCATSRRRACPSSGTSSTASGTTHPSRGEDIDNLL